MNKKNILIVDDDKNMIKALVRTVLINFDNIYSILVAIDGLEAIELMKTQDIDITVLDIHMPNFDGICVCKEVMSIPELNKIPIIVTSGLITNEDRKILKELGIKYFLDKPYSTQELFDTIKSILV